MPAAVLVMPSVFGPGPVAQQPPLPPQPAAEVVCPPQAPPSAASARSRPTASEQFVRPGARRATLCSYPFVVPPEKPSRPSARTLFRDVGALVRTLNGLPPPRTHVCTLVGLPQVVLVLESPGRPADTVEISMNCDTAHRGDLSRGDVRQVLDRFAVLYRQERAAAADPDTILPAACSSRLPADVFGHDQSNAPRDEIGTYRVQNTDQFLPLPVAALTACRYRRSGGELILDRQKTTATDLERVRATLNEAFPYSLKGERDPRLISRNCFNSADPAVHTLDVLLIADTTGALVEVRVARDGCVAAYVLGVLGVDPQGPLAATLDELLNPSR